MRIGIPHVRFTQKGRNELGSGRCRGRRGHTNLGTEDGAQSLPDFAAGDPSVGNSHANKVMLVVWLTPEEMIRRVRLLRHVSGPLRLVNIRARRRRLLVFSLFLVAISLSATGVPQRTHKRKIACKNAENAASCYWTHGRLPNYKGTPTLRLWKIGTKRILSIHSGPGYKRGDNEENSNPEVPANVDRAFKTDLTRVYGDFEICPLEPERPGEMQRVCVESAKNIFAED
jgi:hypothetical protein